MRIRGNGLVINFRCYLPDGRRVRCVEFEGENTQRNRLRVNKNKQVHFAVGAGQSDYLSFFPRCSITMMKTGLGFR